MSLDKFFNKKYDRKTYNCGHFACDVWEDITGESIRDKMTPIIECVDTDNMPIRAKNQFVKLQRPESPCIVLMKSIRSELHVGVYNNGNMIHIREDSVVENLPLPVSTRFYTKVRFYK